LWQILKHPPQFTAVVLLALWSSPDGSAAQSGVSAPVSMWQETVSGATRFENTTPAITYTPGAPGPGQPPAWFHGSRSRDWSSGTASFNRAAGARAVFHFTGTSVRWIGFRAYWAGIAAVYLDGVFVEELDLFLPACPRPRPAGCVDEDDQVAVFTADDLVPGPHVLVIEVTGRRNEESIDNAVVVDAFDVAPASPLPETGTRVENTASPSVAYTGGWTQDDPAQAWSGGTATMSMTTGARTTFTFTGTEVRWIGARGTGAGIARVWLDGAPHAEVDLYTPTDVHGVVFTATGLTPGRHTLAIDVTGLRNPAATGTLVVVDAFDVRSRFEERDASVVYTGAWAQEHMDSAWSGTSANAGSGTAARSATAGARVEFTFSGTEVSWIGARGPSAGIAEVSVDRARVEQVDLYAPAEELRAPAFTARGLAAGPHTLRIDVTGRRSGAATGAFVTVDAFDVVLPSLAPQVTRIQQTDPAVTYSVEGWIHSSPNSLFSGRTITSSTTTSARVDFRFTGTAVRWIGQRRREAGTALVYLDGAFVNEVDTFAPQQDEFQAAVFSATGLAPNRPHILTIEVSGRKHGGHTCTPAPGPAPPPCSAGYLVVLDAFDVY
jgi:trimeric autotransporter adhesin